MSVSGNDAAWLAAWSTFGGAVGGVGAVFFAVFTWRRQLRDNESAQARKVSFILDAPGSARVINNSDEPITDLHIGFFLQPERVPEPFRAVNKDPSWQDWFMLDSEAVVPGLGFTRVGSGRASMISHPRKAARIESATFVTIRFLDSAGVRWSRSEFGLKRESTAKISRSRWQRD
jgi:hypothetical protein